LNTLGVLLIERIYLYLLVLLLPPTTVFGEMRSIQLPMSDNDSKKAFFISPSGNGKFPAIVYMHGGAAREQNDPSCFREKILDYSSMWFVVLAPLRNTVEGCCNGDDAIKEGIRVARESAKHLKSVPNVREEKICLVGFSEGALISMWVMTEPNDFSKALIMSASTQCMNNRIQRAGSENYCSSSLIKSGKL
jgi:dipeptidyl aminopeptidase/acylaminoacyl peptidase